MALPDILTGLLRPAAYPHPCSAIHLVETHISWVLLTGDYAYKIKKPVQLPFVDFGSLERRQFFCIEELRCNRPFAPDLYLEVVAVGVDADGMATFASATGASRAPIEWAVRMRQFAPEQQLDRLLETGALTTDLLHDFGARLAAVHRSLPRRSGSAVEIAIRVRAPVEENFTTLAALPLGSEARTLLGEIRTGTHRLADALGGRFAARLAAGFTRECHGDLHLGNLVLEQGVVTAFDCLEFDANLRWIDTQSDVAFLFMDCLVRGRSDLGYAFLDGYLDASGDYQGVRLLPFYALYRALVRAKVAAIQAHQMRTGDTASEVAEAAATLDARALAHLRWAAAWLARPPGRVVLMSGVSGSGKSYLAERLVSVLPAVRMRSDVARRQLANEPEGNGAPQQGGGPGGHVDAGRYAPDRVLGVYRHLAELLPDLVGQGESVVVDATFISAAARRLFIEHARAAGWSLVIVACTAPLPVLEARVRLRLEAGRDPSEADLAVLAGQLARREPFAPDEPVLEVDTSDPFDAHRIRELAAAISAGRGVFVG